MPCDTLVDTSGLLAEINSHRAAAGVAPLLLSESLQTAALWKVEDQYQNWYCDYVDSLGRDPQQLVTDLGYFPDVPITPIILCAGTGPVDVINTLTHNVEWGYAIRNPGFVVCGIGMSPPYAITSDRYWAIFLGPADDCPGPPCPEGCSCGYTGRHLDYCDCPPGTYPCPSGCDCHVPPCPPGCYCPPVGPCYCKNFVGPCPPTCYCTPGGGCPPGCKTLPNGQCDCSGAQTGLGLLIVFGGLAAIGLSFALTVGKRKG